MIWNQRRTILLYPEVHPIGKYWRREKSNKKQHYLRSFANIVNVSRQHSEMSLSVSHDTSKGGESRLKPTHRTMLLVRYWQLESRPNLGRRPVFCPACSIMPWPVDRPAGPTDHTLPGRNSLPQRNRTLAETPPGLL